MRAWTFLSLHVLLSVLVMIYSDKVVFDGVSDDDGWITQWYNGRLLNETLNALQPGDLFVLPNKTYHTMGGIIVTNVTSVTISFDGTLVYSKDMQSWPRLDGGKVLECMHFINVSNVTFTSSGMGLIDGNGAVWWGIPGIGYLERGENRPRLLNIEDSQEILFENIIMKDSPYWTFWCHGVDGLEVRNSHISVRRDAYDGHDIIDLTAFNTDGFDVAGRNVWIHDCSVWNQDDCIAVKDGNPSENMLFERIHASGLGLTIGSIGNSTVRNITFRDSTLHHTYKGIYMKFRESGGLIEDVLYENITMEEPEQWAIWIGPAQQSDSDFLCAAHPCSLCWPDVPLSECNAPPDGLYRNITLRNILITKPKDSPGVIMGPASNPMENIVFDNVVVTHPPPHGTWGSAYYKCEGVRTGVATGGTWPVPPCFEEG